VISALTLNLLSYYVAKEQQRNVGCNKHMNFANGEVEAQPRRERVCKAAQTAMRFLRAFGRTWFLVNLRAE
jgi:hypothetical protein